MDNRTISLSFIMLLGMSSLKASSQSSWHDARQWSQRFFKIDKDTAEKFMPTAIFVGGVLVAGGIFYLMNKRGDDTSSQESSDSSALFSGPSNKSEKWKLRQLQVYHQKSPDGGGAASCGYHSLLRSMQLVNGISTYKDMEQLKNTLTDPAVIQIYFAQDGTWRKDIIEKREKEEFKKALDTKFLQGFNKDLNNPDLYSQMGSQSITPDSFKSKIRSLYQSALGFIEDWIIQKIFVQDAISQRYDWTDKAIRYYISKGLLALKNDQNSELIEKLQEDENINKYFDLEKIRTNLFAGNWVLDLQNLWMETIKSFHLTQDARGDWLSDGEVEYIWKKHNADIILDKTVMIDNECGFKVIANFDFVGNQHMPEFDEVSPYIIEKIKPHLNKTQQLFEIFVLGTMKQSGETQGTRGHWYPLVMHQNFDGKRIYYVMDSMGIDRTHDTNVLKIINLIEE